MRSYHKTYAKSIIVLFLLIISKRLLMQKQANIRELCFIVSAFTIFSLIAYVHSYNKLTTKLVPYLYVILSYFSHSALVFSNRYSNPLDKTQLIMSKDQYFHSLVQFAGMSINLIYINVFLVTSRQDCIFLNIIEWTFFMKDILLVEGKLVSSMKNFGRLLSDSLLNYTVH